MLNYNYKLVQKSLYLALIAFFISVCVLVKFVLQEVIKNIPIMLFASLFIGFVIVLFVSLSYLDCDLYNEEKYSSKKQKFLTAFALMMICAFSFSCFKQTNTNSYYDAASMSKAYALKINSEVQKIISFDQDLNLNNQKSYLKIQQQIIFNLQQAGEIENLHKDYNYKKYISLMKLVKYDIKKLQNSLLAYKRNYFFKESKAAEIIAVKAEDSIKELERLNNIILNAKYIFYNKDKLMISSGLGILFSLFGILFIVSPYLVSFLRLKKQEKLALNS